MNIDIMKSCTLCPRNCMADRANGKVGYCGQTSDLKVARAALHFWEEPCISGTKGSGAVFFSGCQVGCVFCQNRNIAKGDAGKIITVQRLADIFTELQTKGANNINLVTPTHFVPQIVEALTIAKSRGMNLPIVYNTSSYENVSTLKQMDGLIDIYLPDLKYIDSGLSLRYSNTKDYFEYASKAIEEMYRQVGKPDFDDKTGLMKKGVIVRHLLLPGCKKDSQDVIKYLWDTYENNIFVSIMNQYTPLKGLDGFPEINRKITKREYEKIVDYAIGLGLENGFIQEGDTAKESFIPEFNLEGVEKV